LRLCFLAMGLHSTPRSTQHLQRAAMATLEGPLAHRGATKQPPRPGVARVAPNAVATSGTSRVAAKRGGPPLQARQEEDARALRIAQRCVESDSDSDDRPMARRKPINKKKFVRKGFGPTPDQAADQGSTRANDRDVSSAAFACDRGVAALETARREARELAAAAEADTLKCFFECNDIDLKYVERLQKRGLPCDPQELAELPVFKLNMTLAQIGCDPADELMIREALKSIA